MNVYLTLFLRPKNLTQAMRGKTTNPVLEVPQRVTHHQLAQPPPQPPVYPGMDKSAVEQLGAAVMSHYT